MTEHLLAEYLLLKVSGGIGLGEEESVRSGPA